MHPDFDFINGLPNLIRSTAAGNIVDDCFNTGGTHSNCIAPGHFYGLRRVPVHPRERQSVLIAAHHGVGVNGDVISRRRNPVETWLGNQ